MALCEEKKYNMINCILMLSVLNNFRNFTKDLRNATLHRYTSVIIYKSYNLSYLSFPNGTIACDHYAREWAFEILKKKKTKHKSKTNHSALF